MLDAYTATFEVNKLVKGGHKTAIQLRIIELQEVVYALPNSHLHTCC